MKSHNTPTGKLLSIGIYWLSALLLISISSSAMAGIISQSPLYLGQSSTPIIMLTMDRSHKLYYEAYNDASDINDDGILDIRYSPTITYYGYFDSHKCYEYTSGVFNPVSITVNKQCSGNWSGDYLNYLTMSRMDALRRVLFGGYRSTDTSSSTVLERSHIPQDAHSWGKEYTSTTVDGYNIANYAPLSQPTSGTRHLFANTTLQNGTDPLLRVLQNTSFRVWEWLSIERPVAGTECATGNNSRSNCATGGGYYDSHPNNHSDFEALVAQFANATHQQGTGSASIINCGSACNPYGDDDHYLTVFTGTLNIASSGTYQFAVDGDDAVEVIIDGNAIAGWYGGHGNCNCQTHSGSVTLGVGSHTVVFRHEERDGGDNYYLWWSGPDSSNAWQIIPTGKYTGLTITTYNFTIPASTMTDYVVRVNACVTGLLESECRGYPANSPTVYKPSGILQEYGENDRMAFGLMTGSYAKNTSGGVLRKNISFLADSTFSTDQEINLTTGQFTDTVGIIKTISRLKTVGFGSGYSYDQSCQVPEVSGPLAEGRCRMWGNPTAEMMYEGLRYFAGKTAATTGYSIASTGNDDATLNLPLPTWQNPYRTTTGGFPSCSKPSQIVISDINPNFDTDQLPGRFGYTVPSAPASFTGDLTVTMNVTTLANTIWTGEYGNTTPSLFIGQSGDNYDGAPTAKTASGFGNIRGLSPEDPTKQGGYYSGSVALYGKTTDLSAAAGNQKTDTYSVALASPLPRIRVPIGASMVTLVPFGKTVGGCGSVSATQGSFQPTNTIVDFYVDTIANTDASNTNATINSGRAYAKFRINFEDSEYGSDHDMDAIVEYVLAVNASGSLDITLTSSYAAGGCIQHMGYVISGTSADGIYLEVRDPDTGAGSDVNYFLDTPQHAGTDLPTTHSRNFTVGATTSASYVAHDPLWYAAKWGGFLDSNSNNTLDVGEWDTTLSGTPDTYFLVTNASRLKEQLGKAFDVIVRRNSSSSSVATNSTSVGSDTLIYQARFNSGDWSGQIRAYHLNIDGSIGAIAWDTTSSGKIPAFASRKIYSYDPTLTGAKGISFCFPSPATCFTGAPSAFLNSAQQTTLVSASVVSYLRGNQTGETAQGGTFRDRTVLLGDIVNSDPWYVGTPTYGYEVLSPEGSAYPSFRTSIKNRRSMLYVGANDGMLHGFDATTGVEQFAYVPNSVITTDLVSLAAQGYTHKYFVDGSPMVADAYFSIAGADPAWHTVLVGMTGAGGKGLFALDVTFPSLFTNTSILWEYTSSNDTDLGITIPQPSIVRLYNGQWAAIVSNGYNSTNGKAVLFIINIQDGSLIKKIVADATGNNGLSAPFVADVDGDRIADYVYAGDLHGNLWKFDLTSNSTASWGVAYSGVPLYVAKDKTTPTALNQPITVKPQLSRATALNQTYGTPPQNVGVMVYFGTGKYFEVGDNVVPNSPQVQTFYGIWDSCDKSSAPTCNGTVAARANLQQQAIIAEGFQCLVDVSTGVCTVEAGVNVNSSNEVRVTTDCAVTYGTTAPTGPVTSPCANNASRKGWFMDLEQPPVAPSTTPTAQGERSVSTAVYRGGRIIYSTLIPSSNACTYGGTSWLMEMDALTGQRFGSSALNISGGGAIDAGDNVIVSGVNGGAGVAVSGMKSPIGIIKTPAIIDLQSTIPSGGGGGQCPPGQEVKCVSGSNGDVNCFCESSAGARAGRQSWWQLR